MGPGTVQQLTAARDSLSGLTTAGAPAQRSAGAPAQRSAGAPAQRSAGLANRLREPRSTVPFISVCVIPVLWAAVAASNVFGTAVVGPLATVRELYNQWPVLWLNAQPTLIATLIGAGVLLVITAVGAVFVAIVPRITPALAAVSVVIGTLPLIILTPILSLVVPRGRGLVAAVCVLAGLVPVAAMLSGMASVGSRGRNELGALYGASRLRWWRYVGFWQTVPVLDIGIRAMIPYCFLGSIVAEWSGASTSYGLGEVMTNALFSYEPPLLWATIVMAAAGSLGLLAVASLIMTPLRQRAR